MLSKNDTAILSIIQLFPSWLRRRDSFPQTRCRKITTNRAERCPPMRFLFNFVEKSTSGNIPTSQVSFYGESDASLPRHNRLRVIESLTQYFTAPTIFFWPQLFSPNSQRNAPSDGRRWTTRRKRGSTTWQNRWFVSLTLTSYQKSHWPLASPVILLFYSYVPLWAYSSNGWYTSSLQDKKRHEAEMANYTPVGGVKRKKNKKDPNMVWWPHDSWLFFCFMLCFCGSAAG